MNNLHGLPSHPSRKQARQTQDPRQPPRATTQCRYPPLTAGQRESAGRGLRHSARLLASRTQPRGELRAVALAGVALLVLSLAVTTRAASRPSGPGRAARALVVNDEGHLRKVGESGADLIEEGSVTGTVPGSVRVRFNIGAIILASFVLYPRGGGTLMGHGSGELHSSGRYSSFGGTMTVTSGTGHYRHAHGTGGFYGVVNRKSFALVVQTRGTLHY
jgi:hypothetical protein